MYGLLVLCCCGAHFHGLGSAVQTCPLLIHGAAAGLPGQNSASGQAVMNGPRSLSSPRPVLSGGPLGNADGQALDIGPVFHTQSCCRQGAVEQRIYCDYMLILLWNVATFNVNLKENYSDRWFVLWVAVCEFADSGCVGQKNHPIIYKAQQIHCSAAWISPEKWFVDF